MHLAISSFHFQVNENMEIICNLEMSEKSPYLSKQDSLAQWSFSHGTDNGLFPNVEIGTRLSPLIDYWRKGVI